MYFQWVTRKLNELNSRIQELVNHNIKTKQSLYFLIVCVSQLRREICEMLPMITIIMPTYKRDDFLIDKNHPILNLAKNDLVKNLIIIWQNIGRDVPSSIIDNLEYLQVLKKVRFVFPKINSLNNRFIPYEDIEDCILSIDDDYIITKESLMRCYEIWNKDRDLLVGVTPRIIGEKKYSGRAARGSWYYKYNIILTQGAMFHKKFLELYSEDSENKKIVDDDFNGEDIVFNFVHNNLVRKAPVYVHDSRNKTWKRVSGESVADRAGAEHLKRRLEVYRLMKKKYGNIFAPSTVKRNISIRTFSRPLIWGLPQSKSDVSPSNSISDKQWNGLKSSHTWELA